MYRYRHRLVGVSRRVTEISVDQRTEHELRVPLRAAKAYTRTCRMVSKRAAIAQARGSDDAARRRAVCATKRCMQ